MKLFHAAVAAFAVNALLVLPTPALAKSRYLQCVPYARKVSGIEIRGNAKTWWGQAAGRYERGSAPRVGAVMALPGYGKMRLGHVATVSSIVSDREVLLDHANWSRRGGIERNVRAIDVSPQGDWSRVRIWYAGNGDLGTTSYPVSGFIYPNAPSSVMMAVVDKAPKVSEPKPERTPLALPEDVRAMATAEAALVIALR